MKKLVFIHVLIPLLFGGLIYISFRSQSLRMFNWFEWSKIDFFTSLIRNLIYPAKKYIPPWFYFSLPDALWVYSFTSSYMLIWNRDFNIGKYWLLFPLFFGCIIELQKGIAFFSMTPDIIDFVFSSIGFLLSLLIFKLNKNEKKLF